MICCAAARGFSPQCSVANDRLNDLRSRRSMLGHPFRDAIQRGKSMQVRLITTAAVVASLFVPFAARADYDYTAPVQFHTVANFDPANGVIPFPNNLLLSGTTDLTLNIPVEDASDFSDPKVAMNALDGFSTTAPWSAGFTAPIDASTLAAGSSVRVFEVTLSGPGGGVTGVTRELESPQDFVVALAPSDASGRTMAIVPTHALRQRTSYMAVLTNGIRNAAGGSVRGSLTYLLSQRTSPLCVGGQSTIPALTAERACALEPLRLLTNSQVAAAAAAGVAPESIVMTWVATTQSITPTLQAVSAVVAASPAPATRVAPTGMTLAALGLGLPGVADIHIGTIDLPYYLSAPSDEQITAPLSGRWEATAGAYIAQCAPFGLDPTSTNLTACNPVPALKSVQTVPLLMTVPNASSGRVRPASGWPLVIFQHGITRNRSDMFAIAATLAGQGFAVVAIDLPLHGITDKHHPFYVEKTPFGPIANERTFDLDLQDNATGAPGPDGSIDPSGGYFINLSSLLTSRDNLRQGVADLMSLRRAASGIAGIDGSTVHFVGQSLGSIVGTTFLATDPNVYVGVLSVPGGGIARLLDGSPTFGPRIRAGLEQAGVIAGTPDYDSFMGAAQTAVDSGDPINFAGNGTFLDLHVEHPELDFKKRILVQEVVGGGDVLPDQVIPNRVAGAPTSGTEPLIAALGLMAADASTASIDGVRAATRFLQGAHGSLLDPSSSAAATVEMQGEMASMIASYGEVLQVTNASVLQPAP
jgi:pimeloyl-ACP methyl ester carboxylesterase